jgi:hypothetical protein
MPAIRSEHSWESVHMKNDKGTEKMLADQKNIYHKKVVVAIFNEGGPP